MSQNHCRSAVAKATGNAFSDDEIDDILDRLQTSKLKAQKANPSGFDADHWDAAAKEITKEEVTTALMERRLEVFAERARIARRTRLDALPGNEAQRLSAFDVGSEKLGDFTGASVDSEARALTVGLWSMVEGAFKDDPILKRRLVAVFGGRSNVEFERQVAREMARLNGLDIAPTGDKHAVKAAQAFVDALEAGRQLQNKQGAWIGKQTGYIGRQSHDRMKVAGGFWRELATARESGLADAELQASRKAFRQWRDTIKPLLDEKTFEGLTAREADAGLSAKSRAQVSAGAVDNIDDPVERFLYAAWWNIVNGRTETLGGMSDLGEFRAPAGKAKAVSKSRVLHFKGPDEWMAYAETYSSGGLYGSIMSDLDRSARNAALMKAYGPNPEAARAAEIERLLADARARGDASTARKLQSRARQAEFDELTGASSAAENLRLAEIGRSIRMMEVLSKLGGVVISAGSDMAFAAQRMKRVGGTYLSGYDAVLRGVTRMQSAEQKAVADALDAGARSAAAHMTSRFNAADGPLGWGAWAQRLLFKVQGMEAWLNGARQGIAATLSSALGQQSDRAWSALEIGTREDFRRFGIDEGAWNLLRGGAAELGDGKRYLTGEAADAADVEGLLAWNQWNGKGSKDEAVSEARDELKLRFQSMIQTVLDDAMTEPRARERAQLTQGFKPGTPIGEALRIMTQFLSFSHTVVGRHLAPTLQGYAGQHPVALLAHMIVASTALGYLSLQAKQIVRGRTPRSLENDDGESLAGKLVVASFLQGGGAGIYGDFLFGEASRNGVGFTVSTMMGPAVGDLEKLITIMRKATGGEPDDMADAPGDLAKFAMQSAPGANLWLTRSVTDYLITWRMSEAMSPGYIERYERRVREKEGSDFLIDPSQAITGQ